MATAVPPVSGLDALLARLHAGERAFAAGLPPRRLAQWAAGRVALRDAVEGLGYACGAILRTESGGPLLPAGLAGSISHKGNLAVAFAVDEPGLHVGIDLEADRPRPHLPAEAILTPEEAREPSPIPSISSARRLLLRFSLKEAVYKAIHPTVRRYVDFGEVSVHPAADGTARVVLGPALPERLCVEAFWRADDGHLVTFALARQPPLLAQRTA